MNHTTRTKGSHTSCNMYVITRIDIAQLDYIAAVQIDLTLEYRERKNK